MKTTRSEWPACYYEEEDRDIRKQLLLQHMEEEPGLEADRIRMKLWEMRYTPHPKDPPAVDYFVRSLLSLITESRITINIFNKKQEAKNMDTVLKDLCIRDSACFDRSAFQDQELFLELLKLEYQALASFYYAFSIRDRKYGSVLMGTLSMKDEQVVEKLAGDVRRACIITPRNFGLEEEFTVFREACYDAFYEDFPKQTSLL